MKILMITICLFCVSCSSKRENNEDLCKDFIWLNANKKFKILYEISTVNIRLTSYYDAATKQNILKFESIGVYCKDSSVEGGFIVIPLDVNGFIHDKAKYNQSEKFYTCKNEGKEDITVFKKYISDFQKEFKQIKTPAYHNNNSVFIETYPQLGHFITFVLNEKAKVHLVPDKNSLSKKLKAEFDRMHKVNDSWYYEFRQ